MPDSSLYPVLFYYSIPDRFLPPFKNDRQVFNPTLIETVFPFLLTLAPSVNLTVDTFPDKRGRLAFSILFFLAQQMKNALEMQFTRAVILERWAEQE